MHSGEDGRMKWVAMAALAAVQTRAADLKPQTVEAFDRYARQTEERLDGPRTFLWADESPGRARRVRQGEVAVEPFTGKPDVAVPGGLVHDWVGAVFIPGATVDYTLARLQNYDGHKDIFKPDVIDSRLLSHSGNDFHIYLRLVKKKVVTVVLNTEFDVRYTEVDKTRWRSVSRSRKIAEVARAGKPDERELPAGTGQGFLWKLTTYWRFVERDGGTWVECEAVSLTRDVPMGLGWIVEPIIRNLPRESLANTLFAMRKAIAK
jgi:hypothetical protein